MGRWIQKFGVIQNLLAAKLEILTRCLRTENNSLDRARKSVGTAKDSQLIKSGPNADDNNRKECGEMGNGGTETANGHAQMMMKGVEGS